MNSDSINKVIKDIVDEIEKPFTENGYKLIDTHFENGNNLHSNQYYFAKKFLQNVKNCEIISEVFTAKISEIELSGPTTFVGLHNYTGLTLNKVLEKLSDHNVDYNYEIINQENEDFKWQNIPHLKENLIIVLPIACTFSFFEKLCEFIQIYINEYHENSNIKISEKCITVFLVLNLSLKVKFEIENVKKIIIKNFENSTSKFEKHLYDIYSLFNWTEINQDKIKIESNSGKAIVAFPLVKLYSELHLPEDCPQCFPTKDLAKVENTLGNVKVLSDEMPLFSTNYTFDSPNLILGLPKFSSQETKGLENFFEFFSSNEKKQNIILHGNISANKGKYYDYIRGNAFYLKNKEEILYYFNTELSKYFEKEGTKKILFITSEYSHNSRFLEDLCLTNCLRNKIVTIIQFQSDYEFIDNFISLYFSKLNDEREELDRKKEKNETKIIYFSEVLSATRDFKLISDYIKHRQDTELKMQGQGFDLILTLIDRTTLFTKHEIMKKLQSNNLGSENTENIIEILRGKIISYFNLNLPVSSATNLGNPLSKRVADLKKIIKETLLDCIKETILRKLIQKEPKELPEVNQKYWEKKHGSFFPFLDNNDNFTEEVFNYYRESFSSEKLNLLRIFISNKINLELSGVKFQNEMFHKDRKPKEFISSLIDSLNINEEVKLFFSAGTEKNGANRISAVETKYIQDMAVKILTQYPYIYYKNIYDSIFDYCLNEFDKLFAKAERKKSISFSAVRRLKFYLRRLIQLNSNFIISERFLKYIKKLFENPEISNSINQYRAIYKDSLKNIAEKSDKSNFTHAQHFNYNYILNQLGSLFPVILFYYKELIYRNPSKSITLEQLINNEKLQPLPSDDLKKTIQNKFFHFINMLHSENIYLLNELKEYHKKFLNNLLKSGKSGFENVDKHYNYYFGQQAINNSICINAKKIIGCHKSYDGITTEEINKSVSQMLNTESILVRKSLGANYGEERNFNTEIREILSSFVDILKYGMDETKFNYAFFIEHKKHPQQEKKSNKNIYPILKNEKDSEPQFIYLNEEGLIYNLLYELYDDNLESSTHQSLLIALKKSENEIIGFNDYYFTEKNGEENINPPRSFQEMYNADLLNKNNGTLLDEMLKKANMSIYLRFSENNYDTFSNSIDNNENLFIKGKAVLLITTEEACTKENLLKFINNEKLRLLLLLKEEILVYLNKQFENEAFNAVLTSKQKILERKHLWHGIGKYIKNQYGMVNNIFKGINKDKNFQMFNIVTQAIAGQFQAMNEIDPSSQICLTKEEFIDRVKLIFESVIGGKAIEFKKLILENINFTELVVHPLFWTTILTELIINMKKHGPWQPDEGDYVIEYTDDEFVFSNKESEEPETNKIPGEGLDLCRDIVEKIGCEIKRNSKNQIYEVKLKLNSLWKK
ncbi:MAG: hypothetical protein JST55_16470 [Bacteroidetes bacterium]|nr:hypothetical protein [Bacteroidota bacterium]